MTARVPETRPSPAIPGSSFRYDPLSHVRVLFVRFVQGLFRVAPEGGYRWSPNDEETELFVSDGGTVRSDVLERAPAVTFTRGGIQFYSMGFDDMEQYDFATGRKTKGTLLPGTMTINACSKAELEADSLAWTIAEHLWVLSDVLKRSGFFEIGRSIHIGAPSPAGSIIVGDRGEEAYCTPISVPYQFPRRASATPLNAVVVNSIEQRLHLGTSSRTYNLGSPRNAPTTTHQSGLNIHECRPPSFAPDASNLEEDLPKVPHPLNPSKLVTVRRVYPNRAGSRVLAGQGVTIPIVRPCVEQSNAADVAFEQKG